MAYNNGRFFPQQFQQPNMMNYNAGFVPIASEDEARNYPVAYGNSITFKDENAPYIYTKTMGYSQLDTPKFEKYRLVKEEATEPPRSVQRSEPINTSDFATKAEIEALWSKIEALQKDISVLRGGDRCDEPDTVA